MFVRCGHAGRALTRRGGLLDFLDLLRLIRRRRWLVALCIAIASGAALSMSARATPIYEATARVFIGPRTLSRSTVASGGELGFFAISSRDFVASFAQQLQGRPLAEQVVEQLGLDLLPTEVASNVTAEILQDTRIIEVTYTDEDPVRAALIANGIVDTFAASQKRQGTVEGLQATAFEAALLPTAPVSPHPTRDGILGMMFGAMVGLAGAVGMEQMDTRLRSRGEVETALAPAPVLAEVPAGPRGGDGRRLWLESQPGSQFAESFRILRTNLQFLAVERRIASLLVTSPSPGEGKTTVAANLASSMAAGGYRTLLVDGDLRHPTVHKYFGVDHVGGLADVLAGALRLQEAIRETAFQNLFLMTAGPQPPNPSELFGSQRMLSLIEKLEAEYDLVVFDAPPTLLVADAPAMSTNLDGVIFVARAGVTSREQAREALRRFTLLESRILGAVLNGSRHAKGDRYYYGYGDYYYYSRGLETTLTPAGDPVVRPSSGRAGRRDDAAPRGINDILADLGTLSKRARLEPFVRGQGARDEGGTTAPQNGVSHTASETSAEQGQERP